jgi:hypothetical protein
MGTTLSTNSSPIENNYDIINNNEENDKINKLEYELNEIKIKYELLNKEYINLKNKIDSKEFIDSIIKKIN